MIDHDYINKLSHEEKKWLSNFNEEYVGGNFNHEGKKFHRSKKQKKTCYDRNNARLRDVVARNRTRGWVPNSEDIIGKAYTESPEDILIMVIDLLEEKKK